MSEVIETYIRRHPGLTAREAFEGFLAEDRIKAWVGSDPARRERLQAEFERVWGSMSGEARPAPPVAPPAPPASPARSGPAGPVIHAPRTFRVEVSTPVADAPKAAHGRKLEVMCTSCRRVDVWMQGETIACRSCGHAYDDMLQLIRVTPVGPFEFLFGEGWVGYATATGLAGGLVLLYFLLRGF